MTIPDKADVTAVLKNLKLDNIDDLKILAQYALNHDLYAETGELVIHIQEKIESRKECEDLVAKVLKVVSKSTKKLTIKSAKSDKTVVKKSNRPTVSLKSAQAVSTPKKEEAIKKSLKELLTKVKDKVKNKSVEGTKEVAPEKMQEKTSEVKVEAKTEAVTPVVEKSVLTPKQISERKRYLKRRLATVTGTSKEMAVLKELAALS